MRRLASEALKKDPDWSQEEDDRLRDAYASGERIDLVAEELGRTERAAYSRAKKLYLTHPRDIKGGFITRPTWSSSEDALLRQLYGEVPTAELPERIGRSLRSIYSRAFELDLKHGYQRQWTRTDLRVLKIGHDRGLAVADIADALGRKACSVSKYATTHGLKYGRRPLLVAPISIEDILKLAEPDVAPPAFRNRLLDVEAAKEERRAIRAREFERARHQRVEERATAKAARAFERSVKPPPQTKAKIREVEQRPARQADRRSFARARAVSPGAGSFPQRARGRRHQALDRAQGNRPARRRRQRPNDRRAGQPGCARGREPDRRAPRNEARQECPFERAKLLLQRRYAPVCSMAVYGGDPERFQVGQRKDVTRTELLAMAARVAA
jgi:hypothetical protein